MRQTVSFTATLLLFLAATMLAPPSLEAWVEYRAEDPDGVRYILFRQGKNEAGWTATGRQVCAYSVPVAGTIRLNEFEPEGGRRRQAFRKDDEKETGWRARGPVLYIAQRPGENTIAYYEHKAVLANGEGLKYALFTEGQQEVGWEKTKRAFDFFKCP